MNKYICPICGYVYDESAGIPEKGIAQGTKWEDLPEDFLCPICGAPKSVFTRQGEIPLAAAKASAAVPADAGADTIHTEDLRELSATEISAIFSNLARGCEKQRLPEEMEAYTQIADYFKAKGTLNEKKNLEDAARLLENDQKLHFPAANSAAKANGDRGALRSLVWSEKVTAMAGALLSRFAKEGDAMLEHTKIYVCDICGFIYLGDIPPEICPVCKVPRFRIPMIERRMQNASI